jgi:hypothetical protein
MGLLDHLTEEIFTKTDLLTEGQLSDEPPKSFLVQSQHLQARMSFYSLYTLSTHCGKKSRD